MRGLLVCMVALLAVLGWESLPPADPVAPPPPPASVPAAQPAAPAAAAGGHWAEIALARPLFAPGRHPPAPEAVAAVPETLPRLAGTIRTDDSLLAIFAPEGAHPLIVPRDGTVAGWTVTEITDGEVTLDRDGHTSIVRLGYANQPASPAAPPPQTAALLHDRRTSAFLQP